MTKSVKSPQVFLCLITTKQKKCEEKKTREDFADPLPARSFRVKEIVEIKASIKFLFFFVKKKQKIIV